LILTKTCLVILGTTEQIITLVAILRLSKSVIRASEHWLIIVS